MWSFPERLELANGVTLTALRSTDAAKLLTAVDDPEIFEFSTAQVTNLAEAEAYCAAALAAPSRYPYLISWHGRPVGSTSFYEVDEKRLSLAIGHTWLAVAAQGTGVNGVVKAAMLDQAWGLGVVRIVFTIDERNARSRRAVAKLGAHFEGIMVNHRRRLDGSFGNTARYALTRELG